MKISQMLETLSKAHSDFGDVDVQLMDSGSGDWKAVQSVIKLHPYTGQHGFMNRTQPVNALGITTVKNNAEDLILSVANVQDEGSAPSQPIAEA